MKVFVVYAHPERRSFNGALLEAAEFTLGSAGHEVRVSDLYAMGFDPVARATDFKTRLHADRLDYFAEQRHAYSNGTLSDDIGAEIEKVRWCDMLILQFPLYWFSLPAILKGWVDRVFVPGFAFGAGKWYERGGLAGKRAMLTLSMSSYPEMMAADGLNGLLDVHLWPIQNGVLAFCGFDVLEPFVAHSVPHVDDAARSVMLEEYRQRLRSLGEESAVSYHRRAEFDQRFRMRPEVEPRTVGHYFGRLPADSVDILKRRKP
jgi:NAD(P)H dehydrogenase (quinone)